MTPTAIKNWVDKLCEDLQVLGIDRISVAIRDGLHAARPNTPTVYAWKGELFQSSPRWIEPIFRNLAYTSVQSMYPEHAKNAWADVNFDPLFKTCKVSIDIGDMKSAHCYTAIETVLRIADGHVTSCDADRLNSVTADDIVASIVSLRDV